MIIDIVTIFPEMFKAFLNADPRTAGSFQAAGGTGSVSPRPESRSRVSRSARVLPGKRDRYSSDRKRASRSTSNAVSCAVSDTAWADREGPLSLKALARPGKTDFVITSYSIHYTKLYDPSQPNGTCAPGTMKPTWQRSGNWNAVSRASSQFAAALRRTIFPA